MPNEPTVTLRTALPDDALCLGVLATQVFLDTYATAGIRPLLAREVQAAFSTEAMSALIVRERTIVRLAEFDGHLIGFAVTVIGAAHDLAPSNAPAELDKRLPYDPAKARALLAEAGYPNGFSIALDCVNVAWREGVCQAAAAMLSQVGIRTTLRSSPTNQFFPKLSQGTASFVEFGWTPGADAWASLNALFRSFDKGGLGTFNAGRYSNAKLDVLIDNIRVEPDLTRRRAMVTTVLRMVGDDLPYVPLYRRTLTWAMAKKVTLVQWPNDTAELRWIRVK